MDGAKVKSASAGRASGSATKASVAASALSEVTPSTTGQVDVSWVRRMCAQAQNATTDAITMTTVSVMPRNLRTRPTVPDDLTV